MMLHSNEDQTITRAEYFRRAEAAETAPQKVFPRYSRESGSVDGSLADAIARLTQSEVTFE